MFGHIPPFAGDPILSLHEDYQNDPRPNKINLSIGIYFDEAGRIPVLDSVARAEALVVARGGPKPYLPIEGAANFRAAVQRLLFGAGHEAIATGRIATLQTVGASGGLKVGADFIKRYFPASDVWISDPSWENHRAVFEGAGLTVHAYPYYDGLTGGLRFDDMLATLRGLPPRSVVLLHACCHNPTGVDLTPAQWDVLIPVLRERELLPYLDLAYQGFGDGIEADAHAVRAVADAGLSGLVANSFSKSMSVYGERCGALSVVCPNADEAALVMGQMKATVRRIYSSPPVHGCQIVATVLDDAALRKSWEAELGRMRDRILAMRGLLYRGLTSRLPGRDLGHLVSQRGLFSYTGLTSRQVDRLRDERAVYMLRSGRMCVAGLNHANVDAAAEAMAEVIANAD